MTDLSRRNFLKGFMAAAGVAAVGLPVAAIAAKEVEAPPPLVPFPGENGDVFMQINGVWRFLCRASNLSIRNPAPIEILPHLGRFGSSTAGFRSQEVSLSSFCDKDGQALLYGSHVEAATPDFALSMGHRHMMLMKAWVESMDVAYHTDDFLEITTELRPIEAPQIILVP